MEKIFPRSFCISFSLSQVMSCPLTLILPSLILALVGKSFMILLQSTLFPHPDSPTIASTSPFFNEKETSLTAWTSPEGPSMLTERFLTSNKCSIFNPFSARVKKGALRVPPSQPLSRFIYSIVQSATFQKIPTP